jgi:long-chain acyl-CoA synthetase
MAENFAPLADRKPEQLALIDEYQTRTWREFNVHVNQLIGALRATGLGVGDTVGVLCGNRVELFEVLAATMHAGIVVVPLNWHWVAEEIAYVLDDAEARAVLVDPDFAPVARDAVGRADRDVALITVGDDAYRAWLDEYPADEPDGQVLAGPMFYTSGTTGRPKGVRNSLTRAGLPASMWQLVATGAVAQLALPTDGATLLCGPAYHSRCSRSSPAAPS